MLKNIIKKIKVVFFILSSISTIFSLWYIVGYLITNPNATTSEIESLKNLGLSLVLVLATSMTAFVFWLWEVYLGPE